MNPLDYFYERQEIVVGHLAAAAGQVPPEKVSWKPHDKALSWLYLLHHTGTHRQMVLKLLKGEPTNFPDCYIEAKKEMTSPELTAQFIEDTWQDLKIFLQEQDVAYADNKIAPPWGGAEISVEVLMWWLFEESVHHRGQAWIYARMNDLKPPSIWGTEP